MAVLLCALVAVVVINTLGRVVRVVNVLVTGVEVRYGPGIPVVPARFEMAASLEAVTHESSY